MPDPSFRGAAGAHSGTGNATSLNIPLPVGSIAGDLALIAGNWTTGTGTITLPGTMQTQVTDGANTMIARSSAYVLTSADITAGFVTASCPTNARCAAGALVIADPGAVEGTVAFAQDNANDLSQPVPAIDPTNNSLVAVISTISSAALGVGFTPPASWTERLETITTNSTGRRSCIYGITFNTFGSAAVPATAFTCDGGINAHSATWVYAVNAAAAPAFGSWSLWDGATEIPLTATLWDGASEVPLTTEVAP